MVPEAIAIVMAPTDKTRSYGIFRVTDPSGMSVLRECQEKGFHPHRDPNDGAPLYEQCSHVYINPNLRFEIFDLRRYDWTLLVATCDVMPRTDGLVSSHTRYIYMNDILYMKIFIHINRKWVWHVIINKNRNCIGLECVSSPWIMQRLGLNCSLHFSYDSDS